MTDVSASHAAADGALSARTEASPALAAYMNRCRRLHDRAAAALAGAKTGQLVVMTPGIDPSSAADLSILRRVIAEMADLLPPHKAERA